MLFLCHSLVTAKWTWRLVFPNLQFDPKTNLLVIRLSFPVPPYILRNNFRPACPSSNGFVQRFLMTSIASRISSDATILLRNDVFPYKWLMLYPIMWRRAVSWCMTVKHLETCWQHLEDSRISFSDVNVILWRSDFQWNNSNNATSVSSATTSTSSV